MKKIFFFAALFAAATLNAAEIVIDLNKAVKELSQETDNATFSVSDGVLTVNWTAVGPEFYEYQGVAFPLDDLTKVTNISYEYKGDGVAAYGEGGVCLYPYLVDEEGKRWFKHEYYPNVKNTEWQTQNMLPDECPWDAASYKFGDKPFIYLSFAVNPSKAGSGTFYLKNIKITTEGGTGIENTAVENKAVKMFKDGQMVIVRDGKTYDVLGAER